MHLKHMHRLLPTVLLLALAPLAALPATAQSTCVTNSPSDPNFHQPIEISWPVGAEDPIWELTALPVSLSTGSDGSGLEIRDVRYNGRSVLKRGHIPMLNVRYESGCGCFRDWMRSNTRFEADNVTGACFAQPEAGTTRTLCDVGVQSGDVGSFQGIAMEDFGDGFTLTTQSSAGWYRYTMKWTFEENGTIRPQFGFSNTTNSCALNKRWHHVYWRLDFDIETPDRNQAAVSRDGGDFEVISTETTQFWDDPNDVLAPTTWAVFNLDTERGYSLTPGEKEYLTPANPGTGNPTFDQFAREDMAISRYRAGQLQDNRSGCSVNFFGGTNPIIQEENIADADVVLWYRTGATRSGGYDYTCRPLGPVIRPIGDWSRPAVDTDETATPAAVTLEAFPNPFDQSTTVRYVLDRAQNVRVTLYDALGREVRRLYEGAPPAGSPQELTVDGTDLPSGVYTVQVSGDAGPLATRRIVLVR
jgi:hypothetical protein